MQRSRGARYIVIILSLSLSFSDSSGVFPALDQELSTGESDRPLVSLHLASPSNSRVSFHQGRPYARNDAVTARGKKYSPFSSIEILTLDSIRLSTRLLSSPDYQLPTPLSLPLPSLRRAFRPGSRPVPSCSTAATTLTPRGAGVGLLSLRRARARNARIAATHGVSLAFSRTPRRTFRPRPASLPSSRRARCIY